MADSLPTRCKHCGSCNLRESQRAAAKVLARLLFLHPIRCLACGRRFWRFALRKPEVPSGIRQRSRAA